MALYARTTGLGGQASGVLPVLPSKGDWSIAGLVLPVSGDLNRECPTRSPARCILRSCPQGHQSEHVTAAVTHVLHLLRMLTFYLGVKLPFEVSWSGEAPGVGLASIAAGRGSDTGGWARFAVCLL